ncbi:DUF456 domain-containing protein [Nocardioides sp. LS1]|uniref:DUF456 domain-containing protein n=1 Tax=Nocardioides sp. LS1 TaxID=1027620 RepID=UPI000F6198A2|nr:DUF456 domain-containing protein [Nocardioides sp. LS1]GCD89435.1 membrane protein [Nocardioides sp. LS1]
MTGTEVLVALVIAVGLVGIIVPVLPGSVLVLLGILAWAVSLGTATAWTVAGLAAVLLVGGTVVKYVVPGRRLKASGIPASTQWMGAALGFVGFFVVPVVGLFLGFVLGVYLAEVGRVGQDRAWPSTKAALRVVGLSILIELVAALAATWVWIIGVVVT